MSGSLSGRILFARVIRAGYNAVPVCRAATLNSAAFPATGYAVAVALLLEETATSRTSPSPESNAQKILLDAGAYQCWYRKPLQDRHRCQYQAGIVAKVSRNSIRSSSAANDVLALPPFSIKK